MEALDVGAPSGRCTGHRTRRCRALEHDFTVRTFDPALTRYLDSVFASLAAPGAAETEYTLETWPDGTTTLAFENELLTSTPDPAHAVAVLFWHVNQQAVASSPALVRLHAAGAARDGDAVLLPAPPESGKTTLVAGLIGAGLDYLSDEVVALDPETLAVKPYPKALSIDPGSWGVLAHLRPAAGRPPASFLPEQWQVPVDSVRRGALALNARPAAVVSPRYRPERPTHLQAIPRAEMVGELIASTFAFEQAPRRNLAVLGRLAESTTCYRLSVSDLDEACGLVMQLLDDVSARERR